MRHAAALVILVPLLTASPALACPSTMTITRGDTLSAMAAACDINVETLMQANPGLRPNRLQPGMIVDIPSRPLPSAQIPYNRPQVTVAPPIASSGPGIQMPTNIQGREYRTERPIYVDPTRRLFPSIVPGPGEPGSPGRPFPLR